MQHALLSTEAAAIFIDADSVPRLGSVLDSASSIRLVIYDGDQEASRDSIRDLRDRSSHVIFISFDELRKLGEANPADLNPPGADDLCAIFYTSGSTGTPKGVPMKHKAVVAAG